MQTSGTEFPKLPGIYRTKTPLYVYERVDCSLRSGDSRRSDHGLCIVKFLVPKGATIVIRDRPSEKVPRISKLVIKEISPFALSGWPWPRVLNKQERDEYKVEKATSWRSKVYGVSYEEGQLLTDDELGENLDDALLGNRLFIYPDRKRVETIY